MVNSSADKPVHLRFNDGSTVSELKRWLRMHGCIFVGGTEHEKVRLGSKETIIPRHGSKELKNGTVEGIKEALGLKGVDCCFDIWEFLSQPRGAVLW